MASYVTQVKEGKRSCLPTAFKGEMQCNFYRTCDFAMPPLMGLVQLRQIVPRIDLLTTLLTGTKAKDSAS